MDRSLWWQFEEIAKGEKDPNYSSAILFPIPLSLRHLDLRDRFITANILPPEQKILERSENAEKFQAVLDSIEGINLQNRNFRFVKLTDSAVPKGDFRNTDMRYANLEQSDLKNARFDDSVLVGANIAGANAAGSIFVRANLLGTNLSNTILASTDCSDAIMNLTNLSGSRLLGARLLNSDIRGAILTRADFYGANVTKSDFRFSIVQNTNLTNIWSHVNSDYLPRSKTFYLEKLDILPDFSHSIIGSAEISGDIFLRKSMFLLCSFSIFSGDKLCQDSEIILNIESNRKREPDLIRLSPDNIIKKEALEKILELKNSLTTREININCIGASRHCIEKTEEFLQDELQSTESYDRLTAEGFTKEKIEIIRNLLKNKKANTSNYHFSELKKFICSKEFEIIPAESADTLINIIYIWLDKDNSLKSSTGSDWFNFTSAAQKSWNEILIDKCKERFKSASTFRFHIDANQTGGALK